MLQFVFGRAASGKTTFLLERMRENVLAGKETVFIVPEQFSFETEKTILKLLGDELSAKVSVMSFSRLCDEMERICGGMCGKQLTDAGKLILLSRAMRDCASQMVYWKRYVNHPGFISSMLDSIEEFKINYITSDDLKTAAESSDNPSLSAKLFDIALVYDTYNMLIGERFVDSSDRLTKLYDQLEKHDYFKNKTVFLDTFKSFTGQQYRILNRIIASADDVYIALTNDKKNFKRYDVFENIRNTAESIKRIAASHRINVATDIMLENSHFKSKGLSAAEEILCFGKTNIQNEDNSVCLISAAGIYDEAEFVARTIRRLVRTEGYRYRDFVIIARDTVPYEEAVASCCEKNNVSCFIDKRMPLLDFPTAGSVLAAFNAIQGFSTEHVLRFHKSGLNIFSIDELSKLENYTRLWNISGKKWFTAWDMNPDGLVSGTPNNIDERLQEINLLRIKAIEPLERFKSSFKGNASERVRAVLALLEECNAKNAFQEMSKQFNAEGMNVRSDALRQSWDMMMEIFNSLAECFGDATLEDEEFCSSFKTAAGLATIGVAPQMIDEVSFGSADRIRPSRPKVAFILGANQGVFPAVMGSVGLFGINDRAKLIKLNIPIQDRSLSSAIDEDFLVYTNLCCATEKLFICYSATDGANNEKGPSEFVTRLAENMNCVMMAEPSSSGEVLPETANATFAEGCINFVNNRSVANTYFKALEECDDYSSRTARIFASNHNNQISPETAEKLYGKEIRMSASKLDVFHRCKFSFFCKYGLKTSKLQPADFDVLQRGILIHYVLQSLIENNMETVGKLSDTEIFDCVDKYISEYLESIPGYYNVHDSHLNFLLENIARSLKEVAIQLRNEFAQSEFKPTHCEFKFGLDGKPAVPVTFEGGTIMLNGSIDRVDQWNGYLRIVDYKSGTKNFKLPDILVGQNMQMLLYLYAITHHKEYSDMKSAGIFYMPSKRDKNEKGLAMNGLMVGDETLVKAMEDGNNGEFVPCYKLKSDGSLYKQYASSFVKEGEFEEIFKFLEGKLKNTGRTLLSGDISIDPINGIDSKACEYCEYSAVCRIEDADSPKVAKLSNDEVMENIRREVEQDGV